MDADASRAAEAAGDSAGETGDLLWALIHYRKAAELRSEDPTLEAKIGAVLEARAAVSRFPSWVRGDGLLDRMSQASHVLVTLLASAMLALLVSLSAHRNASNRESELEQARVIGEQVALALRAHRVSTEAQVVAPALPDSTAPLEAQQVTPPVDAALPPALVVPGSAPPAPTEAASEVAAAAAAAVPALAALPLTGMSPALVDPPAMEVTTGNAAAPTTRQAPAPNEPAAAAVVAVPAEPAKAAPDAAMPQSPPAAAGVVAGAVPAAAAPANPVAEPPRISEPPAPTTAPAPAAPPAMRPAKPRTAAARRNAAAQPKPSVEEIEATAAPSEPEIARRPSEPSFVNPLIEESPKELRGWGALRQGMAPKAVMDLLGPPKRKRQLVGIEVWVYGENNMYSAGWVAFSGGSELLMWRRP